MFHIFLRLIKIQPLVFNHELIITWIHCRHNLLGSITLIRIKIAYLMLNHELSWHSIHNRTLIFKTVVTNYYEIELWSTLSLSIAFYCGKKLCIPKLYPSLVIAFRMDLFKFFKKQQTDLLFSKYNLANIYIHHLIIQKV